MLFNLRSLATKPKKPGSFSEKYLSRVTLAFSENDTTQDFDYHVVTEEEEMRPDLIANKFYGSEYYTDLICKYNKIYNPFTIKRGELIRIPKNKERFYLKEGDPIIDKGTIRGVPRFIQRSATDPRRVEFLEDGIDLTRPLPPNVNRPRDNNVKVVDGKIIFGEDVTGINKANCPTPISRSKVVQKLIESKIFK